MSSSEINTLKRKLKISYVAISVLVIVSIGFFFYGIINNIQAQKDKEFAIKSSISLMQCEKDLEIQKQQALHAQLEAMRQRALAEEALANAKKSK